MRGDAKMLKMFYPGGTAASTYEIDFEKLYEAGKRGIIFDIDNTLVEHDAPADERAAALFRRLKSIGFQCCLVSNNDRERVELFNRDIGVHAVVKAGKPSTKGYVRAMELMGTGRAQTIAVGDQIFTDIWGANRAGIETILVGKLADHEEIQIILKRIPEKLILFFYHRRRAAKKGQRKAVNDG